MRIKYPDWADRATESTVYDFIEGHLGSPADGDIESLQRGVDNLKLALGKLVDVLCTKDQITAQEVFDIVGKYGTAEFVSEEQ